MSLPVALLAGGPSTRLRPLTENLPKCLVEIAGQPFILHQLELLRQKYIERVVVCVGYCAQKVVETVGDGHRLGLRVAYSFDGPEPLGTGGALSKALPLLGHAFFVLYGDSYLDMDYLAAQDAFEASGKLGLMTVLRNEGRWDSSNVLLAGGQIVAYHKHQPSPEMQHIDYGLGILRREAFSRVPNNVRHDLADIYEMLVQEGQLAAFEVRNRFYEIGSFQGLAETSAYLGAKHQLA